MLKVKQGLQKSNFQFVMDAFEDDPAMLILMSD